MSNVTLVASSPTTTMSVEPPSIVDPTKTPGSTFNVSINVYDIEDYYACYSWQVHMNWSTTVLNLTSDVYEYLGQTVTVPHITFGDFMTDAPEGTNQAKYVNYDEGWALFGETMIGHFPRGINGSGWLATVEFTVVGTGETVVDIEWGCHVEPLALTFMLTYKEEEIEFVPENGYFSNTATMYDITVDSDPGDLVDFTIDGEVQTTTWSGSVVEGDRTIVMPSTWLFDDVLHVFVGWDDGPKDRTRVITIPADGDYFSAVYEEADGYLLTVNSDPLNGVDFTVDGASHSTSWSGILPEGSHTVVMPSNWMVGEDLYIFNEWEDASTNSTHTVSLTANKIITAYYVYVPPAQYQLTVNSDPIIDVDFTLDGETNTTTWSGFLDAGSYTVVMPSTWTTDGSDLYVFDHWEDNSTSPTRTIMLTSNKIITAYYVAETVVAVDPPTNTANISETFTVDINITNADDLYSWGIKVQWDRDILVATDVTEGPFLQGQPDGTAFAKVIGNDYIDVGCTTLGDWFGVSGNGTLMTVTFNVIGNGSTALDIYYAVLLNSATPPVEIPHTVEDGYFSNTEPASPTTISVDPLMLFAEPGEHFTVNLTIMDAVDVYAWQVNLTFDPSVLRCADAWLPPDHFLAGAPEGDVGLQKWSIFSHSVVVGTCILGDYLGMNGSGTLVTIEFEVVGFGESVLGIDDTPGAAAWTFVGDSDLEYTMPPDLETQDGFFSNIMPRFSVSASPSSLAIQQGNSAISIINVTSLEGFSDTISLSVSSVPSGVTTIFDPPQVTPPPDDTDTSTLTIQVSLTAVPGSYVLTVTGTNGTLQYSKYLTLEVTEPPPPTPPHASFFYSPIEPQVGETVTFDASASFDPDGTIKTYVWDFGDGTTDTAIIATHIFTTAGSYNVTLTVTDDDGLSDASAQSVTVAKLSSTISMSTSTTTVTVGENMTISGCISPTRVGATVMIEHRLLGGTWSILTAATTDENSEYSHVWMPSKTGTYELKASWPGDVNTLPAESLIVTIDVIPPRILSIKLSGEHDYLLMERVKIRLATLVRNAATMEPVSNANVTIRIYNPDGTHWLSDTMVEKLAGTGVYEWESEETIQQLRLAKGVYLAHVNASSEGSLIASDIIEFHIDPPSEEPVQLHLILLSVLAITISVGYIQHRRLSKKLSELQRRIH